MPAEESPVDAAEAPDLFRGGLLYRLMRRFGVDASHAVRTARRAALTGLLVWAPMAVLSLVEGRALPGGTAVPFLLDVAAYVRPLIVVPVLLVVQPVLATAWRRAGTFFHERGIVGPEASAGYDALVARVTSTARGVLPEIVCLALALLGCAKLVAAVVEAPRDAWFATATGSGGSRLTFAGMWAVAVHGMIFFLSLRWIWLLLLWYRFLFGVSRLPLHLFPAHPDRAAGLGFLGRTIPATTPLALAWSAGLCCAVANRMLYEGAKLMEFVAVGIGLLVAVLILFVLPLALVFAALLTRTRRVALEELGKRMARTGERIRGAPDADMSGADGPGLEDLEIAVTAVRGILPIPFALSHLVGPVVGIAVPVVPLVFLAFPAGEVFQKMLDLVF